MSVKRTRSTDRSGAKRAAVRTRPVKRRAASSSPPAKEAAKSVPVRKTAPVRRNKPMKLVADVPVASAPKPVTTSKPKRSVAKRSIAPRKPVQASKPEKAPKMVAKRGIARRKTTPAAPAKRKDVTSKATKQETAPAKDVTSKATKPRKIAKRIMPRKTATPAAPKKPKDDRPTITVDIERGNRMMIRWPADLDGLTQQLTYDDNSLIGNLLGKIEDLKGGYKKKLTPLNYINAVQVLRFIKLYEGLKDPAKGRALYRVDISDEFVAWYRDEAKAKDLAAEAYKVLEYDDATVHERWDDATQVIDQTPKGPVYKVAFPDIRVPLYPWQAVGMQFLNIATRQGKGAFVCDETGLGKTYTLLAHLKRMNRKAVVVCPATLVEGWMRKIRHATDLTAVAVNGDFPLRAYEKDIIVMSYSMLKKHGVWPISEYIERQGRVFVMDEGHYSKNYNSGRTDTCLILALWAAYTIVMTATPLKNRVIELHPLLRMTRRLWTEASLKDFAKMYSDEEDRKEVAEHLQGIMVRRMSKDVWKNPPQQELRDVVVPLSNRQDYNEAERDLIKFLINKGASDEKLASAERGKALVKLNKLRELSANGKIEAAAHIIEKTLDAGEQCIVFCAFNDPLKMLADRFRAKRGRNYKGQRWQGSGMIIGTVPKPKRQRYIDDFMAGKIGLLCIGVTAGGLGIDLPIAAYGYFLDLPWTPADIEQCTGRLMRLGQERDCTFVKVLAEGTIDQRMEQLIEQKAEIFRDTIGDAEAVERVTTSQNPMQENIMAQVLATYMRDASRL